ncbi:hypothetical protein [Glycomyces salinus]|uniref:hypothetical protein n=1 Tax=Glycomyces salinus TaxID=980294 RepID=UPI0018EC7703|nr:hypothetical protein [Glycomyces salinus]
MDLVTEWETRSRDKIEVYADRAEHDGYVIAIGPYGAETAAYLNDIDLDSPHIEWCGRFSNLSELWRSDQTLIVRAVLAAWESAVLSGRLEVDFPTSLPGAAARQGH